MLQITYYQYSNTSLLFCLCLDFLPTKASCWARCRTSLVGGRSSGTCSQSGLSPHCKTLKCKQENKEKRTNYFTDYRKYSNSGILKIRSKIFAKLKYENGKKTRHFSILSKNQFDGHFGRQNLAKKIKRRLSQLLNVLERF